MQRVLTILGIPAIALVLVASAADATQVLYRTPQQLGGDASLVVDGRVTGVRSYWNESGNKIITEATVAVDGTHKGASSPVVRIVQLGGTVGHVRQTVHGALQWHAGEDVLLFLEAATPGAWQVCGFSQGKYLVERDPRTGRRFVRQAAPGGAELVGSPDGTPGPRRTEIPLDTFIDNALGRR